MRTRYPPSSLLPSHREMSKSCKKKHTILRVGSWHLKGAESPFLRRQVGQGVWPRPWCVPNAPTAGPPSPRQQTKWKQRVLDSLPKRRCMGGPFCLHQKMTHICDLHSLPTKPASLAMIPWGLGARGRRRASVPVWLARCWPASHPGPTVTAVSPKQGRLFRPSLAVLFSWLLTLLPVCREGFCLVLATCFSPRMNDGWVACATSLSSHVLGPLLFCPPFHQTVSGIHKTLLLM